MVLPQPIAHDLVRLDNALLALLNHPTLGCSAAPQDVQSVALDLLGPENECVAGKPKYKCPVFVLLIWLLSSVRGSGRGEMKARQQWQSGTWDPASETLYSGPLGHLLPSSESSSYWTLM